MSAYRVDTVRRVKNGMPERKYRTVNKEVKNILQLMIQVLKEGFSFILSCAAYV